MNVRWSWVALFSLVASGAAADTPTQQIATASACKPTPRLVFDPPGTRHSLPQLTWDGKGYSVVGYDSMPTQLYFSRFDFKTKQPKSVKLMAGGVAATATNGTHVAIAYFGPDPASKPDAPRYQSYFTVVDRNGKVIVKPIALGDKTVSHRSPGVSVVWSPSEKRWGVLWSEPKAIMFARVDTKGKATSPQELVADGFLGHSGKLIWTGSAYAVVVSAGKGHVLVELDAKGVRTTPIPVAPTIPAASPLEAALAYTAGGYGVVYRTTRPGPTPPSPSKSDPSVKPSRPIKVDPVPEIDELWFVAVKAGNATKPVVVATRTTGSISTPAIAGDGTSFLLVWPERQADKGFDDRLFIARLDGGGKVAAGYPARLDPEEIHQGYASIAGTGCDLAVSYVLGDPNQAVRVGVVRAP